MKKTLSTIFTILGLSAIIFSTTGCNTINGLTPAQIAAIGTGITEAADEGAIYAIQQDPSSVTYFQLATNALGSFVGSTDLSPSALQTALSGVTGTNQWVNLAITAVVVAYDTEYEQYVVGQVTNNAAAVAWINAADLGFEEALASQTGVGLKAVKPTTPYFIIDGKVDKSAIKTKLNSLVVKK